MTDVAIIIPVHNGLKYLQDTVTNIFEVTKHESYKIIIVESESKDGTREYCNFLAEQYPERVTVLHTPREGITKAINKGISLTKEEDIFLTQNDVLFPLLPDKCWLTQYIDKANENEKIGIVTAANGGGISGPDYLNGFQWVGTWAMYIPRRTIKQIGVLDEGFSPGPGDDIDYTYRVVSNKLLISATNFLVNHRHGDGGVTHYNDNIEEIKQRNAAYFRKKHGLEISTHSALAGDINWNQTIFWNDMEGLEYESVEPIDWELIKDKVVLDYGSGNGRDGLKFLEKGNKLHVCDIVPDNLKNVRKNFGDNGFKDFRTHLVFQNFLPIDDETFDLINVNGVLHHIVHADKVVEELHRVLKKDGLLYVMLYTDKLKEKHKDTFDSLIKTNPGRTEEQIMGYITDKTDYTKIYGLEEAKELFKDFEVVSHKDYHEGWFRIFKLKKK